MLLFVFKITGIRNFLTPLFIENALLVRQLYSFHSYKLILKYSWIFLLIIPSSLNEIENCLFCVYYFIIWNNNR